MKPKAYKGEVIKGWAVVCGKDLLEDPLSEGPALYDNEEQAKMAERSYDEQETCWADLIPVTITIKPRKVGKGGGK